MEEAGQDVPAWLRGEAERLARHQERRREEGIPDNPRGGREGGAGSSGVTSTHTCLFQSWSRMHHGAISG